MPITAFILAPSGTGLSEHSWATATTSGAAWVGNNASSHITLLRATVAEELAVGMEQRGTDRATMHRRVDEALDLWGLRDCAAQDPTTLSTGQTRRVAIASALLTRPDHLVLDCPTDGLDAAAIEILRNSLRDFPGDVTVYDRLRTPLFPDATTHLTLAEDGSLADYSDSYGDNVAARTPNSGNGRVALRARGLTVYRGGGSRRGIVVGPMNLEVREGSVTHLAGANGSGKTTLFLAAMGLVQYNGELTHGRCGWAPTSLDESITQRTALKEVSLGVGRRAGEAALVFTGLSDLASQHPLDMSAADRRKLIVAAALAGGPDALLLDEPTVGLDTAGHAWLADIMRRYAQGEYVGWRERRRTQHGAGLGALVTGGEQESTAQAARPAVLWTCHDAEFAAAASDAQLAL